MPLQLYNPVTLIAAAAVVWLAVLFRSKSRKLEESRTLLDDAVARLGALEAHSCELSAQYDTLLEQGGIGVMALDENGVILRSNSRAALWLNSSVASIIGRTLLEITLSNDLQSHFDTARRIGCVRREVRIAGHGIEIDLVVIIAPVVVAGQPDRYLFIAENVTQLRRLETVRRDFVANVSHELRTPLTGIRAVAETLQQAGMQDRNMVDRFLSMIIAESERLTRISDDLLTLSAAESRAPIKDTVDVSGLIASICHRYQRQAAKVGVTLHCDSCPGIVIQANHDQMEQVIVNLVDNAIKYTHAGGVVSVTTALNDGAASVHVADTGIGLLKQDMPRIFERFYRVDKARSRETGGTGLGLSIVKHIVESHGGVVSVESELNHGSIFTVTLPILELENRHDEGIVSK